MASNIDETSCNEARPPKRASKTLPIIFRIPPLVRERNNFYEPQLVSIGPYHHDSPSTQWMKQHKNQFADDFIDRHHMSKLDCLEELKTLEERARKCYTEDIYVVSEKFVKRLFLDGCFILELLYKLESDENGTLCQPGLGLTTILSDLLLLENQIPFFVLEKLYSIAKRQNNSSTPPLISSDLRSLIKNNLFNKYLQASYMRSSKVINGQSEIHHLLHLFHELSKPSRETNTANDSSAQNNSTALVIPSASRLYESSGLLLQIRDPVGDIFDVTFKDNIMCIPQIVIDSTRRTLLMNLHAFEQHLPKSDRRWTGLMVLMSCIVKNVKDLEILQRNGIVLNLFPSEEEAIQFFKQLNQQIAPDFNSYCFAALFRQLNEYYGRTFTKYKAALMRDFFNNPWNIITVFSSTVALLLSLVQTFYTAYSATHNKGC
ncbi:hypothetical protein LUZ60_013786 [Juncus effusus]|nr:hypothetical protein LUZ60_013786 [Juncus effusus]